MFNIIGEGPVFPIEDENFIKDCEYFFSLPNEALSHAINQVKEIEGDIHSFQNLQILSKTNFNRKLISLLILLIYNFSSDKITSKKEMSGLISNPKRIDEFLELIKDFPESKVEYLKTLYIMLNPMGEHKQLKSTEFDLFFRNIRIDDKDKLISMINLGIEAINLKDKTTSKIQFTMDSVNLKLFIDGLQRTLALMSSEGLRLNSILSLPTNTNHKNLYGTNEQ